MTDTSAGGSASLTVNYKIGISYIKIADNNNYYKDRSKPAKKGRPRERALVIYCKRCRFIGGSVLLLLIDILYYYNYYYTRS